MGRKPHPLVAKYFERGQKLSDSSNRYPHTCRRCGEQYPKGRNDALITHITRRCQAMADTEKLAVHLELFPKGTNGTSPVHGGDDEVRILGAVSRHVSPATAASRLVQQNGHHHQHHMQHQHHAHEADHQDALMLDEHGQHVVAHHREDSEQATAMAELHNWSALEALAEASRQVDMSEKHDQLPHHEDGQGTHPELNGHIQGMGDGGSDGVNRDHSERPVDTSFADYLHMGDEVLPSTTASDTTTLSAQAVAAAATHLSPTLLDDNLGQTPPPLPVSQETPISLPSSPNTIHTPILPNIADGAAGAPPNPPPPGQDSWGPINYKPILPNGRTALPHPPSRGGQKIDVSGATSSSSGTVKHLRAKFSPCRRKEVQEVRKMGACIRCKLLRKTCGPETPCTACRRVLAPRVWTTGCVRTKLSDQVELWSAGLQTLLVTNQINQWKRVFDSKLQSGPAVIMALDLGKDQSLLLDAAIDLSNDQNHAQPVLRLGTLVGPYARLHSQPDDGSGRMAPVMLDYETQDVGDCVEAYMHRVLPQLIEHEAADFSRKVLDIAHRMLAEQDDEMLRKALELWGLAELVDRETCWNMVIQQLPTTSDPNSPPPQVLNRASTMAHSSGPDVYGMFSMQLSAAAERRANMTSKSLLSSMQRILFDSKIKIGFSAYLACLVFIIAIEKEIWMFKAWEAPRLIQSWPLARSPEQYAAQVRAFPGVLRMILSVRRIFPRTTRDAGGKLVAADASGEAIEFFRLLDLDYDMVVDRFDRYEIDNSNSRSIEMHLASHLLLPHLPLPKDRGYDRQDAQQSPSSPTIQ